MDAFARRRGWLAALVAAALGLHVWPPHLGARPIIAGFLPWDLAYALLWMLGAAAVVLLMTEWVWRDVDADPPRRPPRRDEPEDTP